MVIIISQGSISAEAVLYGFGKLYIGEKWDVARPAGPFLFAYMEPKLFFCFRAGKFWSAAPNRGIVTKVNRSNDTNFSVIGVDKGIQFHPFEGQMAVDKPTR